VIVLQYFIEVKTCSKGNYIQGRISIPEDVDKIEILLSDKNSKDHPHFLMIFPTNRNGIKLKEPKEDDKRIFIVRKEFEGVSTFDVQIPGEFILFKINCLFESRGGRSTTNLDGQIANQNDWLCKEIAVKVT
jgi:hypothetical protein